MRRTTVANVMSKSIIAKDPKTNQVQKIDKLVALAKKFGFKYKEKDRNPQVYKNLMQYTLTIFGQQANVVITRNNGAIGSNSPLKILLYIPTYDGFCGDWNQYYKGINKINQFLQKAKEIDPLFLD